MSPKNIFKPQIGNLRIIICVIKKKVYVIVNWYKSLPKIYDSLVDHNHVWSTKNIPLSAQMPPPKKICDKLDIHA